MRITIANYTYMGRHDARKAGATFLKGLGVWAFIDRACPKGKEDTGRYAGTSLKWLFADMARHPEINGLTLRLLRENAAEIGPIDAHLVAQFAAKNPELVGIILLETDQTKETAMSMAARSLDPALIRREFAKAPVHPSKLTDLLIEIADGYYTVDVYRMIDAGKALVDLGADPRTATERVKPAEKEGEDEDSHDFDGQLDAFLSDMVAHADGRPIEGPYISFEDVTRLIGRLHRHEAMTPEDMKIFIETGAGRAGPGRIELRPEIIAKAQRAVDDPAAQEMLETYAALPEPIGSVRELSRE